MQNDENTSQCMRAKSNYAYKYQGSNVTCLKKKSVAVAYGLKPKKSMSSLQGSANHQSPATYQSRI